MLFQFFSCCKTPVESHSCVRIFHCFNFRKVTFGPRSLRYIDELTQSDRTEEILAGSLAVQCCTIDAPLNGCYCARILGLNLLCVAAQRVQSQMGDMVAALVKGSEEEENWILAEVVQFNPTANKYEVDDIDEEQKDRHILSRRRVVPLPLMRANPETDSHALFPKGSIVMALYPQTTCFYKAVVNQLPNSAMEEYEVLFEDATYADGYSPPLNVAQRYVISIKESKKSKSQS
ncbi:SAGA-associated factor 29 [Cephus cinctus]|uniref:SAGA-associated factor 29 n=1 Tax=Cephus cinctus TaxID=211228 RepID=A0AAJ7C5U2_CEPCN|nr:SAGA-associated factor 29 [Cephus cinctus]